MIIEKIHVEHQSVHLRDTGGMDVFIPFSLKKHGGKKYIIAPDHMKLTYAKPQQHEPMLAAVLKAFHWKEIMDKGEFASIAEIAKKEKLNVSYARRVFRITLLAPDIINAILDGKQPRYLSLLDLLNNEAYEWNDQRQRLGFPLPT